ncbi:MAG: hypothetical protein JO040_04935 [Gemmatimonadetes bacterium]|nr:hypothetical protein [Gemmatimonadota bacterium]
MRKKLMLLSALVCIAGSTDLLAGTRALTPCESLRGQRCSPNGALTACTDPYGENVPMACTSGTWQYI